MNVVQIELILIAILTAVTCALPGTFLVLRGVALMSDAISHSILLGIILMFLLTHQLQSPLLLLGAAIAGLATVLCTELLIATRRIKKDAAIGIVFPFFFSIGVILITHYARNVHLDSDMVLLGQLAFAPFARMVVYGTDCGPFAIWTLLGILIINCTLIVLFYKELKMVIFDKDYAQVLGFSPRAVYYVLMAATSITAVGAFDIVGAIVVVALMIVPGATAYLLTKGLSDLIITAILMSVIYALGGYLVAIWADVSIAGSIAMVSGAIFLGIFIGQFCLFAQNKVS